MKAARYRWILFDLDGTLFDYEDAERQALIGTWRALGEEAPEGLRRVYRRINAALWREFEQGLVTQDRLRTLRFERLAAELDLDAPAALLADTYVGQLRRQAKLLDGAAALLRALAGRVELALITNGIADIQWPRLERSGIREHFPVVVISGEVGAAKPAPEIFDEAFRRMGGPSRREVLMVGDNLASDIGGAAAFGIDTCWFNPQGDSPGEEEEIGADYEIRRLDELLAIVGL